MEDIIAFLLAIVSEFKNSLDAETEYGHQYEAYDFEYVFEIDLLLLNSLRLSSLFNTIHNVIQSCRNQLIRVTNISMQCHNFRDIVYCFREARDFLQC